MQPRRNNLPTRYDAYGIVPCAAAEKIAINLSALTQSATLTNRKRQSRRCCMQTPIYFRKRPLHVSRYTVRVRTRPRQALPPLFLSFIDFEVPRLGRLLRSGEFRLNSNRKLCSRPQSSALFVVGASRKCAQHKGKTEQSPGAALTRPKRACRIFL